MFIPDKPTPSFKYGIEGPYAGSVETRSSANLVAAIKRKCTSEEVLVVLKQEFDSSNGEEEMGDAMYNPSKIDVFVQSLLFLGHKSFSHSFAAIAKFHSVFKALGNTEEAQICILRSLFELWKTHQQVHLLEVEGSSTN